VLPILRRRRPIVVCEPPRVVGPIVAATLTAELPELGALDRRRIAALSGLAPIANDSGKRKAPRSISGGRPIVRTALHLAAL
jgi:transposase